MDFIDLPTHRLRYQIDGAAVNPWLLFSNSLGTDLHMWDEQVPALARHFRVLRYDRRGHGASSAPPPPYSMADLGGDVLALLDALDIEKTNFCGLSIGGQVGQWLGVHASDRLVKLVVCATAARIGTKESWHARIDRVRAQGLDALVEGTLQRFFTPGFAAANPQSVQAILKTFVATSPDGYCGCCAALASADFTAELSQISVPLLAISGDGDSVCSPADLQRIADGVVHGRHVSVPGWHLCNLESPQAFNTALLGFLR